MCWLVPDAAQRYLLAAALADANAPVKCLARPVTEQDHQPSGEADLSYPTMIMAHASSVFPQLWLEGALAMC